MTPGLRKPLPALVGMAFAGALVWGGFVLLGGRGKAGGDRVGGPLAQHPAAPGKPPPEVRHSAGLAVLSDPRAEANLRLEAARRIGSSVSRTDLDFLFALLRSKEATESWWVVANEIMERLRVTGVAPDRYSSELTAVISDPSLHPVVRDYAVQHLVLWTFPPAEGSPGESDAVRRKASVEAVLRLCSERSLESTSVPGTAIMALSDASRRIPPAESEWFEGRFHQVVASLLDPRVSATGGTVSSAVHAAAATADPAFLPSIRAIATGRDRELTVRLAAVAALGAYRDEADRAFLKDLASSASPLRHAAIRSFSRYPAPVAPAAAPVSNRDRTPQ